LYRVNPNTPTGGGTKKQGLVSYVGVDPHADRALKIEANGSVSGRASVTVQNQLSGVSSSQFNRASSNARPDGVTNRVTTPVVSSTPVNMTEVISSYTDEFIRQVTVLHDSVGVANLFCSYGILWGTVSQIIRQGIDIKLYFDYFVNLDNISVTNKLYFISQIPDSDIWINNALITWTYNYNGSPTTVTARMQFTYDGGCLYELYSAQLPSPSSGLFAVSGKY
jgi:hypothetical protein